MFLFIRQGVFRISQYQLKLNAINSLKITENLITFSNTHEQFYVNYKKGENKFHNTVK